MKTFNWDTIPVQVKLTADPAAGAEPNGFSVPAGHRYLLTGAAFTLVCDGSAANRTIVISIAMDGTNPDMWGTTTTAQTAGTTKYYFWEPSKTFGETNASGYYQFGLGYGKELELPAGAVVSFTITNKQAGDNASATRYYIKDMVL